MIEIATEVRAALDTGRPVVALESTLITHGMKYPQNAEIAHAIEDDVRAAGAIPATIAVLDGVVRVGLTAAELDALATRRDVAKASRRDLGAIAAHGGSAGTTVAATMFVAAKAGLTVFATGGIGGVHRGAAESFDISADLLELAASPVAVVCAGAKSILDLPKTLEVLETQGVPVIGFGTDEFPAFFARESGLKLDHRCDSAEEVAAAIAAHRRLGLPGGVLIANPVPADAALPAVEMDKIITLACAEAAARGITGKAVTPFLLARLVELTEGRSLRANMALIRNNARLAARVAVALAQLGEA